MLTNVMNYSDMLMVFNLVLFSLTFGSQALDFSKLIKSYECGNQLIIQSP